MFRVALSQSVMNQSETCCLHMQWFKCVPDNFCKQKSCLALQGVSGVYIHRGTYRTNSRPGVKEVPEGSGEQGKMEKTGCKIIRGAPTTLAAKGLMMMIGQMS